MFLHFLPSLSRPRSRGSTWQKANITPLMQPFIFQLHPCFFFFFFLVAAARTVKKYGFPCKWKWRGEKNKLGRKRQGTEALVDLRATGAPESWGLGSLQIRRSVLPALPLRAEQKGEPRRESFYSDAALPVFPSQSYGCSISSLWTSSQKTGFSAVMQTKSLITILGLSSRSHNYGTSYYAN